MYLRRQFSLFLVISIAFVSSGCGEGDAEEEVHAPPVGTTWSVDMNSGTWLAPTNIDGLRALITGSYGALIGVESVQGRRMNLTMAVADGNAQDFCNRTISMNDVAIAAPAQLHFGPADFSLANGITTKALDLSGTMSDDFSTLHSIQMQGSIQLASIPPDFLPTGGGDICDQLALAFVECDACDDGQKACLDAHIIGMTATRVDGLVLEPVTEADSHPRCDSDNEAP